MTRVINLIKRNIYRLTALTLIILVFSYIVSQMQYALEDNAQTIGEGLAQSFAQNQELYTKQYETILKDVEFILMSEGIEGDMLTVLNEYACFINETSENTGKIDIYAAIDGKVVGANEMEIDRYIVPSHRSWYFDALEKNGEIAYTDAYADIRTGKEVVTLSKLIGDSGKNIACIDIFIEDLKHAQDVDKLPQGSSYYLADSHGSLLYYYCQNEDKQQVQEYFTSLFKDIKAGKHNDKLSYVNDITGEKSGVYFHRMDSGWYTVITIPYSTLMQNGYKARVVFEISAIVFAAVIIAFAVQGFFSDKKTRLYDEIVKVLGNSYFALYTVNLENGKYQMLKGSDYARANIPQSGHYEELMGVVQDVITVQEWQEYKTSFSLQNMRKLVKNRVRDFGGDFKRKFNGEYVWTHIQMLYDESLQPDNVVLCFKDVNEAKEQDLMRLEFMKKSMETVESLSKSKNMFFSKMSHDMRTPLNGIIGLAKLSLEKHFHEPAMAQTMEKIIALGNQLLALINDVLDISKIESEGMEFKTESFFIKPSLEKMLEIFSIQAEKENKDFYISLNIEDRCIEADWGKIQQVLNNLLSNAFKFVKAGGKVEFSVKEILDINSKYIRYLFTVKDNGCGMSEEFLQRLYIPFEREIQFGGTDVSGTGLGMAIVYEIVKKMDGTINVESTLGQGSKFDVMIPCKTAKEKTAPTATEHMGENISHLKGKRVLVAEDNEINMEIVCEFLKMIEMQATKAYNGREATDIFENSPENYFDIILMDMQMPVMDGCESTKAIRKMHRKDADIPIIAVTANAFSEDITQTQKAGMNAHISKPIDFDVLKETMGNLLS